LTITRDNINTMSPKTPKPSEPDSQILVKIERGGLKPGRKLSPLGNSIVLHMNYATLYRLGQFVCYLPRTWTNAVFYEE